MPSVEKVDIGKIKSPNNCRIAKNYSHMPVKKDNNSKKKFPTKCMKPIVSLDKYITHETKKVEADKLKQIGRKKWLLRKRKISKGIQHLTLAIRKK